MKKTFTFSIFIFSLSFFSSAQISKGSILLGGDIAGYTEKQVNNDVEFKLFGFYFAPMIGKAIKDNLILGGFFSIISTSNDGPSSTINSDEHMYGLGLFLRKYATGDKRFLVFIQGSVRGEHGKTEIGTDSYLKRSNISLDIYPGISYRVSRKLHLESGFRDMLSLGYTKQESKVVGGGSVNESTSRRYYLSSSISNFNSALYFGFRLLIDKSKGG